ncbi:MAG: hypothetical protein JSV52_02930 [Candidatus Zixiibacteriota bacterium]|nr:MAG: hypothetical protein JSV52_02930 [candidate division Zixibacteria bacterium]
MKRLMYALLAAVFFICLLSLNGFAQIDAEILLKRMIEARGGAKKLSEIRTSVVTGKMIMVAQGGIAGDITITSIYPDRAHMEMAVAGVVIKQGYDGQVAWTDNPLAGGYQQLPPAETAAMKRDAIGYDAFLNPDTHGIEYNFKGMDSDSGKEYYLLEQVFPDGAKTTMYVDTESYVVHKTRVNKGSPVLPLIEESYYSDYREVDGITSAYQVSYRSNGQEAIKYILDQVVFNAEIDPALFQAAEKRFTRDELIADTRQLAAIIEKTHPDPYRHIGGKIAFHRHYQDILQTIPEQGMTGTEFMDLLLPFAAAIGDGHTEIYAHHNVNVTAPGGIPLKFEVVEQSLYVSAVPGEQYRNLLGAILVSVEDVSLDELGRRLRKIRPIDNEYHLLWHFTTNYLWFGPYLQELLPEWTGTGQIRVKLRLAAGETEEVILKLPMNITSLIQSESRLVLPATDNSGFIYDFLGDNKRTAYLRIDHMKYYRESFEARNSLGMDSIPQETLDGIPSATEFFRSLVTGMKKSGTETLIVDLRHNGGGDALMADILMYFLHGKSATLETRWNNVNRLSAIYLESRANLTLEDLNKERDVPWIEGDYDFSEDYSDSVLSDASSLDEGLEHAPTFYNEWESGAYGSYYCPENVIVLTRPWTFSAGFGIAVRLYRTGAVLVGTPSAQAPNSGGNAVRWTLDNSGITGRVAQSYVLNFPDDSELARVLPVHYPLTQGLLASYGFDPNAEVLYALDLLPKLANRK